MKAALERDIEADGTEYLEAHGWFVCKFTSPGLRGVPDRFAVRGGRVVFIEWKRGNLTPSRQQLKRHIELREKGVEVYSFNAETYEQFKKVMA